MSTAALFVVNSVVSVIARTKLYALYGDPGSGALLWQLLIASFIGGLFYLRRAKEWIKMKAGRGQQPQLDTTKSEYAASTEQSENRP